MAATVEGPGRRSPCGWRPTSSLAFIFLPLGVIYLDLRLQSLRPAQTWPHAGVHHEVGSRRPSTMPPVRSALLVSIEAGLPGHGRGPGVRLPSPPSPCIVSDSSAGRPSRSLLILPIALPGVVTGIALDLGIRKVRSEPRSD